MSMGGLFESGAVTLLILAVMAVEAVLLRHYLRALPVLAAGLAAGAALVLALRAALLQQHWHMIALFLVLSFVFHLVEIQQCLRLAKRLQP